MPLYIRDHIAPRRSRLLHSPRKCLSCQDAAQSPERHQEHPANHVNHESGQGEVAGLARSREGIFPRIHFLELSDIYHQFTFHTTMLRENLTELHQASHVNVMKKVCHGCMPSDTSRIDS